MTDNALVIHFKCDVPVIHFKCDAPGDPYLPGYSWQYSTVFVQKTKTGLLITIWTDNALVIHFKCDVPVIHFKCDAPGDPYLPGYSWQYSTVFVQKTKTGLLITICYCLLFWNKNNICSHYTHKIRIELSFLYTYFFNFWDELWDLE